MYDSKVDYKLFKKIYLGNYIEIDVQIVKLNLGHVLLISGNYVNNLDLKVTVNSESQTYFFHENNSDQMMVRGFMLHGTEHDKPIKIVIEVESEVKMNETICL